MFRIPGRIGEKASVSQARPPVILWHGMGGSGATWLFNKKNSPAFILSEAGYDVWLGNTRGNRYSRKHATLEPDADAAKFWDFTWEKAGIHDVSASVYFIAKKTGHPLVPYLGFSQGSTQMFSALAHYESFIGKYVPVYVAMGPIGKL